MKFKKEILKDLLWWEDVEGFEVIQEGKDGDKHRWYTVYDMIFKHDDKFYICHYKVGNTEYQEVDDPFYDYGDEVECQEVIPVEKTIITYEVKK